MREKGHLYARDDCLTCVAVQHSDPNNWIVLHCKAFRESKPLWDWLVAIHYLVYSVVVITRGKWYAYIGYAVFCSVNWTHVTPKI